MAIKERKYLYYQSKEYCSVYQSSLSRNYLGSYRLWFMLFTWSTCFSIRCTYFGRLILWGILVYLGTGKTLMARQIGKMLNTREPKIISGPGKDVFGYVYLGTLCSNDQFYSSRNSFTKLIMSSI